jgi:hypothetical protein
MTQTMPFCFAIVQPAGWFLNDLSIATTQCQPSICATMVHMFLCVFYFFFARLSANSFWVFDDNVNYIWEEEKRFYQHSLLIVLRFNCSPLQFTCLKLPTDFQSSCGSPMESACPCSKKQGSISVGFLIGCCDHSIQKMYWVMKLRFCLTKASITPLCNSLVLVTKLILSLA